MSYLRIIEELEHKGIDRSEVDKINCEAFNYLKHADPKAYSMLEQKLEDLAYTISRQQAEQIVRNMRPQGQVWTYEQVEDLTGVKGCTDMYLAMNMSYNDYYSTAKKFGLQNDANFYLSIAENFVNDPDAEPYKVAKYFMHSE